MHGGGTHGVLVQFDTDDATAAKAEFTAFGKDIAMQIAAANPGYLCEAEVPVSVIEKEKEILLAQISNDPEAGRKARACEGEDGRRQNRQVLQRELLGGSGICQGAGYFCLKYVENTAKELGADIEIVKFVRFEKGEGLEKRADDFAAEVASMMK